MQLVSFPEADVPAALGTQVRALQRQAWPQDFDDPAAPKLVHDPLLRPVSLLLVHNGGVLGSLDLLYKEIVHAGRRYEVGGLSTVVVGVAQRGRGYGHRLVSAAREACAAEGVDLALFTCDRPLRSFYERAGWDVLPGTVLVGGTAEAPFPSDQPGFDKVTMASFFSARAQQHRYEFVGARIDLCPGDIDKLW